MSRSFFGSLPNLIKFSLVVCGNGLGKMLSFEIMQIKRRFMHLKLQRSGKF